MKNKVNYRRRFRRKFLMIFVIFVSLILLISSIILFIRGIYTKKNAPGVEVKEQDKELPPDKPIIPNFHINYQVSLNKWHLRNYVIYPDNKYYFDNNNVRCYFIAQWIKAFPIVNSDDSYLSFQYYEGNRTYAQKIVIYHYGLTTKIYRKWELTLKR